MTESIDVTPKTIAHKLIVRIGKSEAEETNNKRLRSRYCTVEANYRQTRRIARPVCDSRALLVTKTIGILGVNKWFAIFCAFIGTHRQTDSIPIIIVIYLFALDLKYVL